MAAQRGLDKHLSSAGGRGPSADQSRWVPAATEVIAGLFLRQDHVSMFLNIIV
jgi:hypothetical protein